MGRIGISLLWLFLCGAVPTSLSQLENVATGKTYNQSSAYSSSQSTAHPSSYAANGQTSGNYDFPNCIHTANTDYTPWWQVDLGRKYPVSDITLWARTRYIERLYPLNITVDDQLCVRATKNNQRSQSVRCSTPIYGQKVKLTRGYRDSGDHTSLNLCEVQIFVPSGLTNCPVGRYGQQCASYCSNTCSGGTDSNFCYQDNGQCYACPEKYFKSSTICAQCPSACTNRVCDSDSGVCDSCASNRQWGNQCEKSCGQCAIYPCDRNTGNCNGCQEGYHGNQCSSHCSTINPRCSQCSQNGQCTACSDNSQPPSCTDCVGGQWGNQCGLSCSWYQNCAGSTCDRNTGNCNGCKTGYYGDHCNSPCSMITSQCGQCTQDGQCTACSSTDFQSPQCTDCVRGRWGTQCGQSCSWNCAGNTCNRNTGNCNGCQTAGFYGDRCNTHCSNLGAGCSKCTQDGNCTACSGNFQFPGCTVCIDGFYGTGTSCTECTWKCDKDVPCNKTTGHCAECPAGKKGDRCQQDCDNNHYGPSRCSLPCGQCKDNIQCDPVNGHCQQCEPGWYLPLCKEHCTGKTYGENCSKSCGQCKEGQACEPKTGECTAGCGPGFKSPDLSCKTKCDAGMRGENCSIKCGHCQGNATCHHVTGECGPLGCMSGFTGAQCLQAVPGDSFPSAVVGAVVGVLLAIIIVAVVFIFIFRRRRQRANKSSGITGAATTMSSSMEELNDATYANDGSRTPLSFSEAAVDGDTHSKPKEGGRPKSRPEVKPKPSVPAKTSGVIYENIPTPGIMSTEPTKPADNGKSSAPKTAAQPTNGKANYAANGKQGKPPTAAKPAMGKAPRKSESPSEPEDFKMEESVYANSPMYFNIPKGLVLSQLQQSVSEKLCGDTLEQEFGHMNPQKDFPIVNGERIENHYKNRFKSILPYDTRRVELEKVDGDDASDYINASFIKGFRLDKGYIASQGPRDNTHNDFWRMVWQEKVTDIVMLTNLKEGNKDKCSEYWPAEGATLTTRHMEVTAVGEVETRAHFIIRTFRIKRKEGKEKREVKQYHYISWMDHEVPATAPLINFWRYVRTRAPRLPSAPPLVVHCSAGVGRTGTFIALDIAIDQSEQASEVNLYKIVDKLRDDRCYMVQNKGQYEFLHEAVLEAYTSRDTRIEVAAMDTALPQNFNHRTPNAKIDAEYEMLSKMRNCPIVPTYNTANMPENIAKNRNPKTLPNDKHMVYITQHVKGRNQYINGVSMATFLQQRGSILTQLPLPDTLVDFWRLVDGTGAKLIISIGAVEGEKDMGCYWPKEEAKPLKTGPYIIKLKSSSKIGSTLWSYTLTMVKDDSSEEVRLLHYTSWTGDCADDTNELIHLLTTVQASDTERGDSPVIFQCIDGSLRSGVLCAMWDVVSRMSCDEELDVYLAARLVTIARPEAFVSVEQYRYCYEVALQIKDSYNVYSNM